VVFIGVNVPWDKEQMARLFVAVYKVPYPVVRDAPGTVAQQYGIDATPTTLFIDKHGRVVARVEGEEDVAELAKHLEAIAGK
jgi:cytochrome oxidase Cu insertion factor (SCO1/SenC/PrrC family)